jgi:surface protein
VFETGPLPLGVTLKINSITLEGIDASARCDISFGENTTYTWSAHSGTVSYTQEIDKPAMIEGDVILGEDASFIVIPRKFPATSNARIVFNITDNGRTYDMYAPLAGQEWKPGETNIYQISYHGEHKAVLLNGPSFISQLAEYTGGASDKIYDYTSSEISYTEVPNVKKIIFVTNSNNTEGELVNAPGERPIYMKKSGSAASGYVVTITTDDFEFYLNEDASRMFQGLVNLTSIEGLENVNTSYVVKLNYFFSVCKKLTSVDLSHFNTENVTHMNYLFTGCEQLQSVDFSSFTTDNVKGFAGVFAHAHTLSSITWGEHFQLINCTTLAHEFTRCDNLVNLDLSFIQGSTSDIDVAFMFDHCGELKTVNIENLRGHYSRTWCTFRQCNKLQSINLGSFQTLEKDYKKTAMLSRAANSPNCTITCNQLAWDAMTSDPDTYSYTSSYTANIVPQTTEP